MVAERDGMVHIVSISRLGKLCLVKSMDVVPSRLTGDSHYIRDMASNKDCTEVLFGSNKWMSSFKITSK